MVPWLHCNYCIIKFRPNIKFFLTQCKHILCENCYNTKVGAEKKCLLCKSVIRNKLHLTNDIPENVQTLFLSPMDKFEEIKSIMKFQWDNMLNFILGLLKKYEATRFELKKRDDEIQKMRQEFQQLQLTIQNLQKSASRAPVVNNRYNYANLSNNSMMSFQNANASSVIFDENVNKSSNFNRNPKYHEFMRSNPDNSELTNQMSMQSNESQKIRAPARHGYVSSMMTKQPSRANPAFSSLAQLGLQMGKRNYQRK